MVKRKLFDLIYDFVDVHIIHKHFFPLMPLHQIYTLHFIYSFEAIDMESLGSIRISFVEY
jgi:hypothetical protein